MISIIIPTLNEEKHLRQIILHTLKMVEDKTNLELIVVDAGSTDGTIKSIEDLEVKIIVRPELLFQKYASMNHGADQSSGDILLFLDADTHLPQSFDTRIQEELKNNKLVGGAFEFSFENPDWKLWILTILNRIRYRFSKVYYGDQAVFVRKQAFNQIGRVPEEPLMEAAFLCKALRKVGRLALLRPGVRTSARRFLEHGFFKVAWFDLNMFIRFNLGIPVSPYAEKYWNKNLTN